VRELAIDIETSPNVADVWGLFRQTVGLNQLHEVTRMICFSAQWRGARSVMFHSEFHDGREAMIDRVWSLLDEADTVVTWNGDRFDLPHIRRELLLEGRTPPSPARSIDLMKEVRRVFRFTSNKLQHVSTQLGLPGKVGHSGHSLWTRCLEGDERAWAEMRRYAKQDTALLWQIYDVVLPWIDAPHFGLYTGEDEVCPKCGADELIRRGYQYTKLGKYQRFVCDSCGSWSRGKKAVSLVDERAVA
jgi:uncharacterized protein YprB with RNaseH-like and TPR domain